MHNLEAEQHILGAILMNNEALNHCDGLEEHHFHNMMNRNVFAAIHEIISRGEIANPITVPIEKPYLVKLVASATSITNTARYSEIVIDLAKCRQIRDVCLHGSTLEGTSDELLAAIEPQLLAVTMQENGTDAHVSASAQEVIERAERAYKHTGEITGISTGFAEIDRALSGLNAPDLIIVAGRPSMGKTALAMNIAENAAIKGKHVGIFSLEMSATQLTQRMIAGRSGIPANAIQAGRFNQTQFQDLIDAQRSLSKLPLTIDDAPALSISALRSRARRMKRRGMELMVVDYLQLLKGSDKGNRVNEITEISQGLKAIAKELNIPVIALSQLSRQVESREDKMPMLSDLRESGSIEQDADIVMFVYREEYYLERAKPTDAGGAKFVDWCAKYEACKGQASLIIAKHRNGACENLELGFKGATTQFHDINIYGT